MMRLPTFQYHAPETADEAARILREEGPSTAIVAGGTDLYPNMKRRHQTPETLVSVRRISSLKGRDWEDSGVLRIGPGETLRALERDPSISARLPALHASIASISTPILRNMGTIGGNVCLDTRCNYYNQNYEWRRAINFCMKCDGDTCWVAPGSSTCWAVNSSDTVPVLIALGSRFHLVSPDGIREVPALDFFRADGIDYLAKKENEILTSIEIPDQNGSRSIYLKLRRREAFDFPVLGVAARLSMNGDEVGEVDLVINAVGPAPLKVRDAETALQGKPLTEESIEEAAAICAKPSKPLDNTDFEYAWRKKMVRVYVARALRALRDDFARTP